MFIKADDSGAEEVMDALVIEWLNNDFAYNGILASISDHTNFSNHKRKRSPKFENQDNTNSPNPKPVCVSPDQVAPTSPSSSSSSNSSSNSSNAPATTPLNLTLASDDSYFPTFEENSATNSPPHVTDSSILLGLANPSSSSMKRSPLPLSPRKKNNSGGGGSFSPSRSPSSPSSSSSSSISSNDSSNDSSNENISPTALQTPPKKQKNKTFPSPTNTTLSMPTILHHPASASASASAPTTNLDFKTAHPSALSPKSTRLRQNSFSLPTSPSIQSSLLPMAPGRGRPITADSLENALGRIVRGFGTEGGLEGGEGLTIAEFGQTVVKDVCGFPTFFNKVLFNRILDLYEYDYANAPVESADETQPPQQQRVTFTMFCKYYKEFIEPYDEADRFFNLVKNTHKKANGEQTNGITREDFIPFIEELLVFHPGLEFLSDHDEFQEKYAITVITRIFYIVDTQHSGIITAKQARKSNLFAAFVKVEEEEDINKVTEYFSYEVSERSEQLAKRSELVTH